MLVICRQHTILHGLDGCEDGHERRAQLMRNVAGKTVLELEVLLERRCHVVKGLA